MQVAERASQENILSQLPRRDDLPTEVWVAGKGRSIDKFNWGEAGYVIGLNETALVIDDCDCALAKDYSALNNYKRYLHPGTLVLLKKSLSDKYKFHKQLVWDTNEIIQSYYSIITVGLEVLYWFGVDTIHMVGFDSVDGDLERSPSVMAFVDGGDVKTYNRINPVLMQVIDRLPINIIWEHRHV